MASLDIYIYIYNISNLFEYCYLYVCIRVSLVIRCTYGPISLSLAVALSVYISIPPCLVIMIYLSIYLSFSLYLYLYISLFICLSLSLVNLRV